MDDLSFIEDAFSDRAMPGVTTTPGAPVDDLYEDARAFQGKPWQAVTCADLEKYTAAPYGFNPDAFCYYLPGVFSAGMREGRPDLAVNDAIVSSLDFGSPENWTDFFLERWPLLELKECEATLRWLLWLAEADPAYQSDSPHPSAHNPAARAFDTINHLIDRKRCV